MFDVVFPVKNDLEGNPDQRKEEDEEDRDEVFTVELMRGPHGLGLALVDGMVRNIFVLFLYSILVYSFYSV